MVYKLVFFGVYVYNCLLEIFEGRCFVEIRIFRCIKLMSIYSFSKFGENYKIIF